MLTLQKLNTIPGAELKCTAAQVNKRGGKRDSAAGDFSEVFFGRQPEGKQDSPFKTGKPDFSRDWKEEAVSPENELEDIEDEDKSAQAGIMFFVPQITAEPVQEAPEAPEMQEIPEPQSAIPADVPQEEILLEPDTPQNVVSVLEGNSTVTDTVPQPPATEPEEAIQQQFARIIGERLENPEDTARMPQPREAVPEKVAAETEGLNQAVIDAIEDEAENLCPLENENDSARDEGEEAKSAAPEQRIQESSREKTVKDQDSEYSKATQTANDAMPQVIDLQPQKLVADVKMEAAVKTEATATQENLFDTMVEQIEMSRAEGTNIISIQLRPEFLGKVNIQLSMTETGLHAKIQSDDQGVRGAISSQINQLIESLSEKGIKVADVEVEYTGVSDYNQNHDGSQGQNQAQYQNNGPGYYTPADKAADDSFKASLAENETQETAVTDEEISSVEYRA